MKLRLLITGLIVVGLTLALKEITAAQKPELQNGKALPLSWRPAFIGPYQIPEGLWVMSADTYPFAEAGRFLPQATGGPDEFGYTWDDSVPLNWIDASGGTDTGIDSNTDHVGPISIGFPFKFYENTYTQLYISRFGFVAFNDDGIYNSQSRIPSPERPNDVIAPHWVPVHNVGGYVRYLSGGTAPNRWFVVEWNRLQSNCCDDAPEEYTFELILYENGDIVFQYGNMTINGSYFCQVSGIEDSAGEDGLSITDFCRKVQPNHAVRIYRPPPAARVQMRPAVQGRFTHAGATETFQVQLRNTGELGADTYDLTFNSSWPVSLYAADGMTPLTDTDGDGKVDTGSLVQGSAFTVTVKVQIPSGANVGDYNAVSLTARSSRDTAKSKKVTLQTAVPAPFVQVYRDNADGAMRLYLVQPAAQAVKKVTANEYYGYDLAVAETPNGNFVYAWSKGRCLDQDCKVHVSEVEYTLLNRYGETIRAVSKLINNSGVTINTYDSSPTIAVAPNGRVGILWKRSTMQRVNDSWQRNENVYFAILDGVGNIVYGPSNITNNTAVGDPWSDPNVPAFYNPQIVATDDNRFVLGWQRTYRVDGCSSGDCRLDDIYYTVRDTAGNVVKGVTQFTHDTTGSSWSSYWTPSLASLSGNRVLLAYLATNSIAYAVLDSAGNVIKGQTSTGVDGRFPDAVQLSNGRIVIAWGGWTGSRYEPYFAVLDGTSYNIVVGPKKLGSSISQSGGDFVSVTADAQGHAVLTWMDSDWSYHPHLYYALVDGNGSVLTPPMIFRTSQALKSNIFTSYTGYGNTSYSWTPPSGIDGVVAFTSALVGGQPGGNAAVDVRYTNYGTAFAASAVLTATLGSGLNYVSDTSGVAPTVNGNDVVWKLPGVGFLENKSFTLYVSTPSNAAYGTRYPITMTLSLTDTDVNPVNNIATAEVMIARQVFLPLVGGE